MSSVPQRASLLGLPRELRFLIYEFVFSLPTSCPPNKQFLEVFTASKAGDELQGAHNHCSATSERFEIPWRNLPTTCRTIASEINAVMEQAPLDGYPEKTTYFLDLCVSEDGYDLQSLSWRNILCPPNKARTLQVNIFVHGSQLVFWSNAGVPTPFVESSYQACNWVLHCGPRMDPSKPLKDHMRVRDLVVTVHGLDEDLDKYALKCLTDFTTLPLVHTILSGYIDKITIKCDYGKKEIPVDDEVWKKSRSLFDRLRFSSFGARSPLVWTLIGYGWGARNLG